ncbi:MAG: MFS transporter [Clostridia bacterium]|nr:MFS transporter [Clostridia bacterium]
MNEKQTFGRNNWVILILFGLVGQIAWSVENMYFNLFVFDTVAPNLGAITLMIQLSGVMATVATLIAGAISDNVGNRRKFISIGYAIWGVTVALFGYLSPELAVRIFGVGIEQAVTITLAAVIIGDCVMTLFGSTANDACFNAWVTDNTKPSFRGTVEGVLAILPLIAMLIVAGGFGILVELFGGYSTVFLLLGIVISLCGIVGIFIIKDSDKLEKNGTIRDIFYGFRPSVVKENKGLYAALLVILVYGVACQIFMPYLIIYMKTYLGFSVIEYSIVFGVAIALGAVINVFLGRLSDKMDKKRLLYVAAPIMAAGLFVMYLAKGMGHIATIILFGVAGFVMITGYIFVSALTGAIVRDNTPPESAGKLQGVRMVFSVLIPMLVGPMIGNGINKLRNVRLENAGADAMTTEYIPAPEIFLAAGILSCLLIGCIWLLCRCDSKKENA